MELLKAIKKTSLTCIRKLLRTACGIGLLLKNFTFAWKFIIYYLGIAINDLVISLVLVECAWDWKLSGTDYPRLLFYSDLHLLGKCCHHSIAASSAFAFIRLGCVVFVFVCILRRYAGCQTSWHRFTPVHFCFCFFFSNWSNSACADYITRAACLFAALSSSVWMALCVFARSSIQFASYRYK